MSDEDRLASRGRVGGKPDLTHLAHVTALAVRTAQPLVEDWERRWLRENPGAHRGDCTWPDTSCTCGCPVKSDCDIMRTLVQAADAWLADPEPRWRRWDLKKAWDSMLWAFEALPHQRPRPLHEPRDPGPEWWAAWPTVSVALEAWGAVYGLTATRPRWVQVT